MTISNIGKTLFASFVILGIAGWIILVIPDLHFLYKDYLGLLGQLKLLALVLAAVGMRCRSGWQTGYTSACR